MRHFHANSHVAISTYTINGGEYVSFETQILAEAVRLLAAAFESDFVLVSKSFGTEVLRGLEYSTILAPSEFEVLSELYKFYLFVKRSVDTDGRDTQSRVFSYFNLNTGKSVVWSHTVC